MEDDDDDTSPGAILKIKCLINVTHDDYFIKVEPQWTRKFFGEGGEGEGAGVAGPRSLPNKISDTGIFKRRFGSVSGPPDTHRMNSGWGLLLVQSWLRGDIPSNGH